EVRPETAPYCVRANANLGDVEAYTVFCLHAPLPHDVGEATPVAPAAAGDGAATSPNSPAVSAEDWLAAHRREVASLLTEEPDPTHLSDQESDESTTKHYSYYDRDLVVMDWDAALI